jgi:predicted ATPase
MINRLYIDNLRSFVNFEWKPGPLSLLLGDNGAGKTTIFMLLHVLRDFTLLGTETAVAFPARSLTAWDSRLDQTFELGIQGNGGQYTYRLVIEHDPERKKNRIKSERLAQDNRALYEYAEGLASLYGDDGSAGASFPFDSSRSAIATIPERQDNTRLTWFRRRMSNLYVFYPDPVRMRSEAPQEVVRPDACLHTLASWLRHLSQERMTLMTELLSSLREPIAGLRSFGLSKSGETARTLKFDFEFGHGNQKNSGTSFSLPLETLSEGQRNLVALYTILHAVVGEDTTLCIDEPDNYVALREIQPWLIALKDKVEDKRSQCLMISHHPELINYLAADHGEWFYREEGGPTRVKRFEWKGDELVPASEIIARGWA